MKELRGKAVKIISFLLKELPDENRYKMIFVERNLREVIASQNKRLVRRGEPVDPDSDEQMIQAFEAHLQNIRQRLAGDVKFEVLDLKHGNILNDPAEQAEKISAFLSLHGQAENMARVVDPSLHRNRA